MEFAQLSEELVDKTTSTVHQWFIDGARLLPNAIAAVLVIGVFALVSRFVAIGVTTVLFRATRNRPISDLMGVIARLVVLAVGLFMALGLLHLDKTVTSLLAGVGVVGLALGFAFQDIAANFMAGFIMALRRPFDVGDLVEVAGRQGIIRRIDLRSTRISTLDGLTVTLPNKDIFQNPIVNYTDTSERRMELTVGVAYDTDLEATRALILKALESVSNRDVSRSTEAYFEEFGDSSINCRARVWLTESDQASYLMARNEAVIAIKKAFDGAGVVIPFPIRTLDFGSDHVGGVTLSKMKLGLVKESG